MYYKNIISWTKKCSKIRRVQAFCSLQNKWNHHTKIFVDQSCITKCLFVINMHYSQKHKASMSKGEMWSLKSKPTSLFLDRHVRSIHCSYHLFLSLFDPKLTSLFCLSTHKNRKYTRHTDHRIYIIIIVSLSIIMIMIEYKYAKKKKKMLGTYNWSTN